MRKKTKKSTATSGIHRGIAKYFDTKIKSIRVLINQARGPAKFDRPSPATLRTFNNWISKGAAVQVYARAQVARWALDVHNHEFDARTGTASDCRKVLDAKFGKSSIKAVAKDKNGQFMVCVSQNSIWGWK